MPAVTPVSPLVVLPSQVRDLIAAVNAQLVTVELTADWTPREQEFGRDVDLTACFKDRGSPKALYGGSGLLETGFDRQLDAANPAAADLALLIDAFTQSGWTVTHVRDTWTLSFTPRRIKMRA